MSIVGAITVTAIASVEHRCTLIRASQLLSMVSHFFTAAIWARLSNDSVFLDIVLG